MAAILRSAIGRAAAARRAVPESLLTLLRGPRPSPAAPEVDLLAKKVGDARTKDKVIQLAESLIQEGKKKYEPPLKEWEAVPLLMAISFAAIFAAGCEVGSHGAAQMRERRVAGNLKDATASLRV